MVEDANDVSKKCPSSLLTESHPQRTRLISNPRQRERTRRVRFPSSNFKISLSLLRNLRRILLLELKKKVFCRRVGWRALDENLLRYQMTRMDGLKTPVLRQSTKQNSSAQMTRISVYSEEISFCSKKICHRSRLVRSDLLWNVQTFQFMDDIYTSWKSCPSREGCWIVSFSELDFFPHLQTSSNWITVCWSTKRKDFVFVKNVNYFVVTEFELFRERILILYVTKKNQRLTLSIVIMMTVSITSLWKKTNPVHFGLTTKEVQKWHTTDKVQIRDEE